MGRSRKLCGAFCLTLASPLGVSATVNAQDTEATTAASHELAARLAVAESVIAAEEAASERAFDPVFRAKARVALATRPSTTLESQAPRDGLGLNALGDSQADLVYTPVTPCRIIDTRIAGGVIGAGTTRTFLVTGTDYSSQGGSPTTCGVPHGPTTAAMVNFVAVDAAGRGNLQVTPFGIALPQASIINYTSGFNLANGLAVAICNPSTATCVSDITIQANVSTTHLVADVQGYFQRVSTGGVGTALLADGAVTAPKIGTGVVVRSLNGQSDVVTLAGSNGLGVSQASGTVTVSSNATSSNTAGTIVVRDGSGDFSAGTLTVRNLGLAPTSSSTFGVLTIGGGPFLHDYGSLNTFVGLFSGNFTLTGAGNSVFGNGALRSVTSGSENDAFGLNALMLNTTGSRNAAFGTAALLNNTTGNSNSAYGSYALRLNTTGSYNAAFGADALYSGTAANSNSAFGYWALRSNSTGSSNAAFGRSALTANTTAWYNSAFGDQALEANSAGFSNSAFGYETLTSNTTGGANAAFGASALAANTTASGNAAFGALALQTNGTTQYNVAIGYGALRYLTAGGSNIAVGYSSGASLTTGSGNIYIGNSGAATEYDTIRIGGVHAAAYIGGIYSQASASGVAVLVNSSGKLGTNTSSRRYKESIVDMDAESDVLLKLRPVSFYYRPELDETHSRQYGLLAEEVAELAPHLVLRDAEGAPQAVRYHFVNAMLLNEVQKQRRLVDEQGGTIRKQESEIRDLETRLAKLEAVLAGER